MPLVIAGATSGSTTVQATDAVTATITLPSATGTVQLSGAAASFTDLTTTGNTILGNASTDTLNVGNGGLVKDASGNLGIGRTTLTDKLSIESGSSSNQTGITLYNNNGTDNIGNSITFKGSYGAPYAVDNLYAQISGLITNYNGTKTGNLVFSTGAAGTISERMRIDSSGNVGIGVTPSAWSGYKAIDFGSNAVLSGSASAALATNGFYGGGANWTYKNTATAALYQQPNSGGHAWSIAPSGTAGNAITFTQAMTLDASGNLGVGTASPATRLDVSQTNAKSATGVWQTQIFDSTSQTTGVGGGISFSGYKTAQSSAEIFAAIDAYKENSTAGNAAGALRFHTQVSGGSGLVERARIDSSGNLLVGTTSLGGTGLSLSGGGTQIISNYGSTYTVASFRVSGTQYGYITTSTGGTNFSTSSDYRLKENIASMTGALDKVALLKPVTYTWKADGSDGQGFIAHELAEIVPDCVTGEKDAVDADGNPVYQGIDTSFLVATLTAAIQELKAIVDTQAEQIKALQGVK